MEKALNNFNEAISELNNVNLIDISTFVFEKGINYKYYYTYNAIINPAVKNEFQKWFVNKLSLYNRVPKKCLVLDLDNTLWGGILSEDGIENLKISGSYPGNVFSDFQKMILELKRNGIVLCISSKNDEAQVKKCFKKRDDLILKYDDFTIKKISWKEKSKSILEISEELNIGLDSIVFIDDSKYERELVRNIYPEVCVLDFPEEQYLITNYFSGEFENLFAKQQISYEDKQKPDLYKKKLKADEERKLFDNIDDYIKSLNIKVEYQRVSDFNIRRIHELINKTNTFNTTTKRYGFEELLELKNSSHISAIKVSDKFGDLGIVGCAIIKTENDNAVIDSFMLSCRVLGRKIEYTYLDILEREMKKMNIKKLVGIIIPNNRNKQVQTLYKNAGFKQKSATTSQILYEKEIN